MTDVTNRAMVWLLGRDTGMSSKTILAVMMCGVAIEGGSHPHDGADLGRCLRLLRAIPEWRPRLREMAAVSPEWAALVDHWEELAAMHERKDAGLYDRMRHIIDGAAP